MREVRWDTIELHTGDMLLMVAPPSKARRTGTPAQAAFAAAGREPVRGDVSQWLQQSDLWQVRALSAEAALRDMGQRFGRSQEEKRAAKVERDSLRWDRDKLPLTKTFCRPR